MAITSESKKTTLTFLHSRSFFYAMTYVAVTFLVLVFLNFYCSDISKKVFYESKQKAMSEKVQLIANELELQSELTPLSVTETLAKIGSVSAERLLITDSTGATLFDSAPQLTGENTLVGAALDGSGDFAWDFTEEAMISQISEPISGARRIRGCVYLLEQDREQGLLIHSLQRNILVITLLLEVGLLLFSLIYAYRYSQRLREILASMRIIQEGTFSHKVTIRGRDELSYLGKEFNRLTERLETSERKRRQFVSDASHELKTPLASIKLLSDSILQNDMDMETVRDFVADIGAEADRLNRMTMKLLELTKGVDDQAVEAEIIYLSPTIHRVTNMLSPLAAQKGIEMEMDLSKDAPILIHEDDLYQITFNLVENGIKYNTFGGYLHISLHRREDWVVLRVSDTGVGIPPESISHIFERFYRVDKARSRQSGGSGLGLAIVKAMVERNDGQITLESTLGKGTVFTVEFPRIDTEVDVQ